MNQSMKDGLDAKRLNLRASEVEHFERKWILACLRKTEGRIRGEDGSANLTGIKPTTLEARMKKLGISKAELFEEQSPTSVE